jgi:ATP phosphoribosyltransferase
MIKLALPGGDAREPAAALLSSIGLHSGEYTNGSRAYRFPLAGEETELRVFREKDIPIQVALGNYDLGICNGSWLQELVTRYPQDDVVALRPLGFGQTEVIAATSPQTLERLGPVEDWPQVEGIRIVSEYPNLAESFALTARLPRFQVVPVWGAAASYPPEDADLAVFGDLGGQAEGHGLTMVASLWSGPAWLLANRGSLASKDLSAILHPLLNLAPRTDGSQRAPCLPAFVQRAAPRRLVPQRRRSTLRLAIPDGHAQRHTQAALAAAGLEFGGYGERESVPRPRSGIDGLEIKVIRPQDMPQQIALNTFDLAVTGRDWLRDHLVAFPSSPVREVLDLQRSRYSLCAVVDERIPGDNLEAAIGYWRSSGTAVIRIASEYANLADQFARQHHFGRYQIVPVSGASEGFVPEDCEILIEGTETGASVAANRLKVIHRLFESTNCVIARSDPPDGPAGQLFVSLLERLRSSVTVSV